MSEFKKIVEPLYEADNLQEHVRLVPDYKYMKLNKEYNPNLDWWCVKQITIRGNVAANGVKDDFYTFISNNPNEIEKSYGQYKDLIKQPREGRGGFNFYYHFNNKDTLFNFINYLKTDFCRGCLYLIKNSPNFMRGELKVIPWFDFTNINFSKSTKELDDYLFKKYNINQKIRNYIENILPDYYNIRDNKN